MHWNYGAGNLIQMGIEDNILYTRYSGVGERSKNEYDPMLFTLSIISSTFRIDNTF